MEQNKNKTEKFYKAVELFNNNVFFDLGQWHKMNDFDIKYKNGFINYERVKTNENYCLYTSNDSEIEYIFNSDGFRSQHFKKISNKKTSILVAGCSNTFGYGLPYNLTWPSIVNSSFKQNNINAELYSVASTGLDTDTIVNNIYKFVDLYGKLDYILMLLPPINRSIVYKKDKKVFSSIQIPTEIKNIEEFFKYFNKEEYFIDQLFIHNVSTLLNLEIFCKNIGINLLWFSWDLASQKAYENINFKNLINLDFKIDINLSEDDINNKYWIIADDKDHPGIMLNRIWANNFLKSIF